MNGYSQAVTVQSEAGTVYQFLCTLENLPRWAKEFCQSLRFEDGHWMAHSAGCQDNPSYVQFVLHPDCLVVDMLAGPTLDTLWPLSIRVHPIGINQAVVQATLLPPPSMPGEIFRAQQEALAKELGHLAAIFEDKAA